MSESELTFFDDVTVDLIDVMGTDVDILQAARVSLLGENDTKEVSTIETIKLINYLMRNRHGTPFEHVTMKFYVKAPIFVFREFHRHRVGFSYNEMSARYKEMPSEFYVPHPDRPLVNIGTSAKPQMALANQEVIDDTKVTIEAAYYTAWESYQYLLGLGIAKEMARVVLPVGIMSQMYVTLNARSMMHFLSLRTHEDTAVFVSRPQYEIELVARKMEAIFAEKFPLIHDAFVTHGRVSP